MFYRKNVGPKERFARFIGGAVMAGAAFVWLGFTPLGWLVAAGGVTGVLTGMVGFCPACALVSRRLDETPR